MKLDFLYRFCSFSRIPRYWFKQVRNATLDGVRLSWVLDSHPHSTSKQGRIKVIHLISSPRFIENVLSLSQFAAVFLPWLFLLLFHGYCFSEPVDCMPPPPNTSRDSCCTRLSVRCPPILSIFLMQQSISIFTSPSLDMQAICNILLSFFLTHSYILSVQDGVTRYLEY